MQKKSAEKSQRQSFAEKVELAQEVISQFPGATEEEKVLTCIEHIHGAVETGGINQRQVMPMLSACLKYFYAVYGLNKRVLPQIESTLLRDYQAAERVLNHLATLSVLGEKKAKQLQDLGIYSPESYQEEDLYRFLETQEQRGPCDLLLTFPRIPYTTQTHEEALRVQSQNAPDSPRTKLPVPSGYMLRLGDQPPLALVEGRDSIQISEALKRYRGRVRRLIIGAHSSGKEIRVVSESGEVLSLSRRTVAAPWAQAIWACLDPNDPTACIVIHACKTGIEKGIGETIQKATKRPVWAPMWLTSKVTIAEEPEVQFWTRNKEGEDVPVATRCIQSAA